MSSIHHLRRRRVVGMALASGITLPVPLRTIGQPIVRRTDTQRAPHIHYDVTGRVNRRVTLHDG